MAVQARRANISCQSSLTLTGALASYDIPEQEVNRGMPQWLSRCIAEAAKHLDEAPFLQLLVDLKNDRFQHHSVSHAVLQVRLHRPFLHHYSILARIGMCKPQQSLCNCLAYVAIRMALL